MNEESRLMVFDYSGIIIENGIRYRKGFYIVFFAGAYLFLNILAFIGQPRASLLLNIFTITSVLIVSIGLLLMFTSYPVIHLQSKKVRFLYRFGRSSWIDLQNVELVHAWQTWNGEEKLFALRSDAFPVIAYLRGLWYFQRPIKVLIIPQDILKYEALLTFFEEEEKDFSIFTRQFSFLSPYRDK